MLKIIMKKYALSRQGAKDLVIATISCMVHNLTLMLPVSLLYLLVSDLYAGGVPQGHLWIYIVGMVAAVLLILFSYRWVYGATYYATYKESSVRRISLAEKLRKLPLSFFGKRDLSDLTTTIMADCTTLEQSFSHWIPELLKLGIGTVALVGGMLLANNAITVLTFFMYLLVVSRLYDPLSSSLQNLAAIISTNIPIERMNEIENYPVQPGTAELRTHGYDIVFDNVSFAYNTGEQVLSGVSFTAKQGEVTALIGPSGGGKSTAAKLAARFWDADSGKITLGGTDVKTVDPEKLLSAYSIVFQDVTLFNNTVMENIRIGRQGATDEEVLAAAREAQCDEFVQKLPEGYQTMIGENGSALSGGERQRISIARALLKDSPVILLDEATASLDAENETHIQRAISRLVKGKTVLIIAHRMRTVEGADKLVLLKDGKVAEQGSPEELLAKGGIYAKMCQLQQQSGEWRI